MNDDEWKRRTTGRMVYVRSLFSIASQVETESDIGHCDMRPLFDTPMNVVAFFLFCFGFFLLILIFLLDCRQISFIHSSIHPSIHSFQLLPFINLSINRHLNSVSNMTAAPASPAAAQAVSHLIQLVKASAMRTRPPILETPLKSGF
jgi:hypothetical protein